MMGFGYGMGYYGLIWMFLFWGGLILLAILLIKLIFPVNTEKPSTSQSAQEILKTRYAKGELTQEQYQQMLQNIEIQ